MPFDFSPHSNISPEAFKSDIDPYQQILPNFVAGQQQQQANRKKQLLQAAIGQIAQDPMMQKDPIMQGIMPLLQANPDMLEQVLPALIHARSRASTMKQQQPPVNTIYDQGTGQLQAAPQVQGPPTQTGMPPASPPMGPGQVPGQMPYPTFVQRMASQAGRKDSQQKFETIMTQKTNQTLGPINDAILTTQKLMDAYDQAAAAKEVGPAVGRLGGAAAGITGGKKFPKLFNYNRSKKALISILFKGIGVNRFTMAEINNLIQNLPSGGEDPARGKQILTNLMDVLKSRKSAAAQQLQDELMIYRGVMMPGGMGGGGSSDANVNVNAPESGDSMSQFEE